MLVRIVDPHEESLDTPLELYYAINVAVKNTSTVIDLLNDSFPMENSRHLKRIRKIKGQNTVSALICKVTEDSDESKSIESKLSMNSVPFESVFTVQVPQRRPLTKKQYETWNLIWPLVFHESMDEKLKLKQLTEHSAIFNQFETYFLENNLSLLVVESILLTSSDSESFENIIIYESNSAKTLCMDSEQSFPFDHIVLDSLNGNIKNKRATRNNRIPYLLSGCIAILSHEPCIMCSMALLHSRIDAIIFHGYNKNSGALGSNCFLHSMDSLNHHFPAYLVDNNLSDEK